MSDAARRVLFLDTDVINTFLQWRFQPNRQSAVVLVVAFTADKDDAYYPVGPSIHATNYGFSVLFKEPVKPEKLWGMVFRALWCCWSSMKPTNEMFDVRCRMFDLATAPAVVYLFD